MMQKTSHKLLALILIMVTLLAASGCNWPRKDASPEPPKQETSDQASAEKAIMDNFAALVQKPDVLPSEIVTFIEANIAAVTPSNAAVMVMGLEKLQREKLPAWQQRFADGQIDRQTLFQGYQSRLGDEFLNSITDKQLQQLLAETKRSGYKLETAEGDFFPVIDYEFYQRYRQAVTADIAAYIDIMAVESAKTPIKDAALMISWQEIVERALSQEQYLRQYPDSPKMADVRQLLNRYTTFALYGANNTPLFSYENNEMVQAAKQAYSQAEFSAANGSFSQAMAAYLLVLKDSHFRLTDSVQQYRQQVSANLS